MQKPDSAHVQRFPNTWAELYSLYSQQLDALISSYAEDNISASELFELHEHYAQEHWRRIHELGFDAAFAHVHSQRRT